MAIYFEHMFHVMFWLLPLYGVGRVYVVYNSRKESDQELPVREVPRNVYLCRKILLAIFILFMVGLLSLTFGNGVDWMQTNSFSEAMERLRNGIGVNVVPFRTIRTYLKYAHNAQYIWVNIIGNIVMFIPWGFCLPLLWEKNQRIPRMTFMSLLLPVCIEFLQLFVGRSVDVDDIILNFTGGMLGAFLYFLLRKCFPGIRQLALKCS